jgi:hypothetical protein
MTALVYPACFLALAALSGLAAAPGPRWALRMPLIAVTPLLALAVWWQLSQRDGLPTGSRPADGSAFVAGVVQPPTPNNAGAIYLWAQPPNSDTPRSYRLPYSHQLERRVALAARAAKHGARVGLRAAIKPPASTAKRGGQTGKRGAQVPSFSAVQFYRLPPPEPAVKGRRG